MKKGLWVGILVSLVGTFLVFQNCSGTKFASSNDSTQASVQEIAGPGESQNCEGNNANLPACLKKNGNCQIGGQTVESGRQIKVFLSEVPDSSGQCQEGVKVCVHGLFYGSNYSYLSCKSENTNRRSCSIGNEFVAHGGSVKKYKSSVSEECESPSNAELRTCSDGTLSGSALFSSCTSSGNKKCVLPSSGIEVSHGGSVTMFRANTATASQSCQQLAESRTCSDGVLSGTATHTTCQPLVIAPQDGCDTETVRLHTTGSDRDPFQFGMRTAFLNEDEKRQLSISLAVCKTLATKNADSIREGVGYYRYESIQNACPTGFHPIENRELRHIKHADLSSKFQKTSFRFENGQFRENSLIDYQSSMRLWTTDSYFFKQPKFTKILWNGAGGAPEIQNGISSSYSDLQLPVLCVRNSGLSINNRSQLEVGGCAETVEKDGFTYCTKNSELVTDYSKIIVSEGDSYSNYQTKLMNFVARPVYDSRVSRISSFDIEKSADGVICPEGFEFPDSFYHIKNIRSIPSIESVPGLKLYYGDAGAGNETTRNLSFNLMKEGSVSISSSDLHYWAEVYTSYWKNRSFNERLKNTIERSTNLLSGSIQDETLRFLEVKQYLPHIIQYTNQKHFHEATDFEKASSIGRVCMKKNPPQAALIKAGGCEERIKLGTVNLCKEASKTSTCPANFRPLSYADLSGNFEHFFGIQNGTIGGSAGYSQGFDQFTTRLEYNTQSGDFPYISGHNGMDQFGFYATSYFAKPEAGYYLAGLRAASYNGENVKSAGQISRRYFRNGEIVGDTFYYFSPVAVNVICVQQ